MGFDFGVRSRPTAAPQTQQATTPAAATQAPQATTGPAQVQDGFDPPARIYGSTLSGGDAPPANLPPANVPPANVPPVTAAPSPAEESARVDAEKVAEAFSKDGSDKATKKLEEFVKNHPNDPAYADALIARSDETLKKISESVVKEGNNPISLVPGGKAMDDLQRLTRLAEAASPAGRAQLGSRLAEAIPDSSKIGPLSDAFKLLAKEGRGALIDMTMASIEASKPQAAKEMTGVRLKEVERSTDNLEDAQKKASEMDARLQSDLAQFGQAMEPAQISEYQKAFLEKHKDVYDAVDAAANDLAGVLDRNHAALEAAGAGGDKDAASQLYDGYKGLAHAPGHADEAVQWMGRVAQAPKEQNPFFATLEKDQGKDFQKKLRDEFLAPAMPLVQAEILANNSGGSPEEAKKAAYEQTSAIVTPLKGAAALTGVADDISMLLAVTGPSPLPISRDALAASRLLSGWGDKNPFDKAVSVMAVTQSAFGAVGAAQDGDYLETIRNSAAFADGGLELSAGVLHTLRYSSAGTLRPMANGFANLSADAGAKFAPVLGIVADGIQMQKDIQAVLKSPDNAGRYLELVGTGMSLGGDFAMRAGPVGLMGGLLLKGVGAALNGFGGVVASVIDGNKEKKNLTKEQAELLTRATGLDDKQAKEVINAGSDDLQRLQALGVTPTQLQDLARDPNVKLDSLATALLTKTAIGFGLHGQDVVDLLKSYTGGDQDRVTTALARAFNTTEARGGAANRDLSAYRTKLHEILSPNEKGRAILAVLDRAQSPNVDYGAFLRADILKGDGIEVSA
ncbi:hypothetical protein JGU66_23930 [Myxococcaceae bacterium JPH2]|nr:hypothetical protein [Myxococcaceae bacterium JPH2]